MEGKTADRESRRKSFLHARGVTYFDKRTERSFFFFVTIVMLAWGILEKFVL
ncbi:MAG: hypothetical protein P8175_16620 [Deltaproteobacteria bacterium]|jgi:hypothetical protein